jgi:hypothetical protein
VRESPMKLVLRCGAEHRLSAGPQRAAHTSRNDLARKAVRPS